MAQSISHFPSATRLTLIQAITETDTHLFMEYSEANLRRRCIVYS